MRRFIAGTDDAFADLGLRAKAVAFVQFRDAELPPGCVPPKGRVGLKVDPATGASVLYIELGVRYYGADSTARRWIDAGELLFPTFEALRDWLRSDLKRLFQTPVEVQAPPGEASVSHSEASDTRPTSSPSSPGAPAPSPGPGVDRTPCATSPPAAASLPADVPSSEDLVTGRLVALVVRRLGAKHGVEVRTVDARLVAQLADRLRSAGPDDDIEHLVENVVGDPLSLAALEGRAAVVVHAGPPVTCTPVT